MAVPGGTGRIFQTGRDPCHIHARYANRSCRPYMDCRLFMCNTRIPLSRLIRTFRPCGFAVPAFFAAKRIFLIPLLSCRRACQPFYTVKKRRKRGPPLFYRLAHFLPSALCPLFLSKPTALIKSAVAWANCTCASQAARRGPPISSSIGRPETCSASPVPPFIS